MMGPREPEWDMANTGCPVLAGTDALLRFPLTEWTKAGVSGSLYIRVVCQPVPRWERICNLTLCSFAEPCDLARAPDLV